MIALRGVLVPFGSRFTMIRAASKLMWRYALVLETAAAIRSHFKFAEGEDSAFLVENLKQWRSMQESVPIALRVSLSNLLTDTTNPERLVGFLADCLHLNQLEKALGEALRLTRQTVYLLFDRLDEGYEPDDIGVGIIDGLVHAAVDFNSRYSSAKCLLFLRDNIFRAVAQKDPDYSRNVEGQVLRLHWDEYHLLNLITNRIRKAFSIETENSHKVWDQCTSRDLQTSDGFRRCLRLTLFRPRDLLLLLNDGFYRAFKHNRREISNDDIESVAKELSNNRLVDLIKEYEAMFPGLENFCKAFANLRPELTTAEVCSIIERILLAEDKAPAVAQHLAILNSPEEIIRSLHSVGFLGLENHQTGSFTFCHDGKEPHNELGHSGKLLVHPCYWIALNLTSSVFSAEEVAEIYDDYDIKLMSETPELRSRKIGQFIGQLSRIQEGDPGASAFEEWCREAIAIAFAPGLRNIQLKPNGSNTQRRDIVARNQEGSPAWKRIFSDYQSRLIVFEVKNYRELGDSEYRQMNSYLCREYGRAGFLITRGESENLEKEKELRWAREMYNGHSKTIVKLTGKWLCNQLSKLRSPQKHDPADNALNGLLDRYVNMYFQEAVSRKGRGTGNAR